LCWLLWGRLKSGRGWDYDARRVELVPLLRDRMLRSLSSGEGVQMASGVCMVDRCTPRYQPRRTSRSSNPPSSNSLLSSKSVRLSYSLAASINLFQLPCPAPKLPSDIFQSDGFHIGSVNALVMNPKAPDGPPKTITCGPEGQPMGQPVPILSPSVCSHTKMRTGIDAVLSTSGVER
jgi:hypothetical protein